MFEGSEEKTAYNVFSQNAWYAGSKLAPIAGATTLKKLMDTQMLLSKAFEDLIGTSNDEQIIRNLFVSALGR